MPATWNSRSQSRPSLARAAASVSTAPPGRRPRGSPSDSPVRARLAGEILSAAATNPWRAAGFVDDSVCTRSACAKVVCPPEVSGARCHSTNATASPAAEGGEPGGRPTQPRGHRLTPWRRAGGGKVCGNDPAGLVDAAILEVDAPSPGVPAHLVLEPRGVRRRDLVIKVQVQEFDKLAVFHLKSSPSFDRRLSRARAIRLLTVPTEIPRIAPISSYERFLTLRSTRISR